MGSNPKKGFGVFAFFCLWPHIVCLRPCPAVRCGVQAAGDDPLTPTLVTLHQLHSVPHCVNTLGKYLQCSVRHGWGVCCTRVSAPRWRACRAPCWPPSTPPRPSPSRYPSPPPATSSVSGGAAESTSYYRTSKAIRHYGCLEKSHFLIFGNIRSRHCSLWRTNACLMLLDVST